ncbi:hypothetical protein D9M71_452950 [compost metagenome]
MHRLLAPRLGGGVQAVDDGLVAGQAGDDFDQRHDRRRVEEVQAGDTLGALEGGGQRGDRQRGGVAGEDAVVAADRFQLGEQAALDLEVLDDGLDHQGAALEVFQAGGRGQAGDHGVAFGGVQLAGVDALAELLGDAGDGLGGGAFAGVEQGDRMAGLGSHLGDAGAHGAGADHRDGGVFMQCGHLNGP